MAKVLAQAGVITKDTPLSGSSGGALASVGIAMGACLGASACSRYTAAVLLAFRLSSPLYTLALAVLQQ